MLPSFRAFPRRGDVCRATLVCRASANAAADATCAAAGRPAGGQGNGRDPRPRHESRDGRTAAASRDPDHLFDVTVRKARQHKFGWALRGPGSACRRLFVEGGTWWLPDPRAWTAAARRGWQAAAARRRRDSQGDRFRPPAPGSDQRTRRRRHRRTDRKGHRIGDAVRPPSRRAQADSRSPVPDISPAADMR